MVHLHNDDHCWVWRCVYKELIRADHDDFGNDGWGYPHFYLLEWRLQLLGDGLQRETGLHLPQEERLQGRDEKTSGSLAYLPDQAQIYQENEERYREEEIHGERGVPLGNKEFTIVKKVQRVEVAIRSPEINRVQVPALRKQNERNKRQRAGFKNQKQAYPAPD